MLKELEMYIADKKMSESNAKTKNIIEGYCSEFSDAYDKINQNWQVLQ